MDELLKELEKLRGMTSLFSMWDVAIAMVLSFLLALIVAKVYKETHRGISYSQSYVHTVVLMAVVVSIIMLIIGSNIARAFSLVGALSIIRFRNAVKETRDVGFVFFAMAIGMACGTRFYLMAVFFTLLTCSFILIMYKMNLFAKEMRERILMVQVPEDFPYETAFEDLFRKYFLDSNLISIENVSKGELIEVIYSVTMKSRPKLKELLKAIREINNNNKVTLIEGQQQIDL
ncbi:DUF4956 domain-containing protein [Desulfococcaceae bacterium HSG7]|nr:DUF4956 domain-containing protein [Desulfococcaceae bacterium HSG7]